MNAETSALIVPPGLAIILARCGGAAIDVEEVLGITPEQYMRQAIKAERQAREIMQPYEEAGLVVRHTSPVREPPMWWTKAETEKGAAPAKRSRPL